MRALNHLLQRCRVLTRVLVTIVVLLTALAPQGYPASARTAGLVVAYYVHWDARSWHAFESNPDAVDIVAGQWVEVDPCGGISTTDDQSLKRFAREHGVRVFPSVVTFPGWLNHRLLADAAIRERLLNGIVEYIVAEDYEGFDLDLEGVEPSDRAAYTSFVETLGTRLHEHGKQLSLALGPKTRDVTTGWAGAYDYAALGTHADLVTIMTYEFSGPWGEPGPIAPAPWVDQVMAFATSQIPAEKVLLGLAFYGYDWNLATGQARALGYPEFAALTEQYGGAVALDAATRSGRFQYEARSGAPVPRAPAAPPLQHEITRRTAPPCSVIEPPKPPSRAPRPSSPPGVMEPHDVWIEESTSAQARLEIADRYQTGGVAAWRLGQDDPDIWPLLRSWRAAPVR